MDAPRFIHVGAMARLFELRQAGRITWREFGVGVVLASFMDPTGGCFPGRATVAERAGIADRNVSGALRKLEKAGFIRTESRAGRSNNYQLTLDDSDTGIGIIRGDGSDLSREGCHDRQGGLDDSETQKELSKEPTKEPMKETPRVAPKRKRETPTDPRVKIFIEWFAEQHRAVIGSKLVVVAGKDGAAVRRVLGQLDLEDLQGRALAFLQDPKSFPAHDKGLSAFCMGVNRYGYNKPSNPLCSDALRRSLEAAAEVAE